MRIEFIDRLILLVFYTHEKNRDKEVLILMDIENDRYSWAWSDWDINKPLNKRISTTETVARFDFKINQNFPKEIYDKIKELDCK